MTTGFPHFATGGGSNLTLDRGGQPMEFMTVAFAVLMNGWVFAASGALVMLAMMGTYYKSRERELMDEITSLKAMVKKIEEETTTRTEKQVVAIKLEMHEQITALKRNHEKETASMMASSNAKEQELKAELTRLTNAREEYILEIEKLEEKVERDEQECLEKTLHLRKEAEDRLDAQKLAQEQVLERERAEHARTIAELKKKVSALETALLHW